MEAKREKVMFLGTPGRRHLVVELEQNYSKRDLAVLLNAFSKNLVNEDMRPRRRNQRSKKYGSDIGRIVGPGYVIEMLAGSIDESFE